MYDIYINDISCIEQKILPTTRPDIPAPVKNYNEYDIPGRDGKLYEDLGTYDDICVRPISGMTHSGSVKKCF